LYNRFIHDRMVIEVKVKGYSFASYDCVDVVSKNYEMLSIPYRLIRSFEVTLNDIALELMDGSVVIRIPKAREVIHALKRRGIKEIKYPFSLSSIIFLSSLMVFILIVTATLFMGPAQNITIAFMSLAIFYLGLIIGNTLNFSLLTYSHTEVPKEIEEKVRKYSGILKLKCTPSVVMSKLLTREFSAGVVPLTNSIIFVWLPKDEKAAEYVIVHELVHLKKRHGLKSIIAIFIVIAVTYLVSLLLNHLRTPIGLGFTVVLTLTMVALLSIMALSYYQELEAHLIANELLGHKYFNSWVGYRLRLIEKGMKLLHELGIGKDVVISKLEVVERPKSIVERLKVWLRNYPHPPTYFVMRVRERGYVSSFKFIGLVIKDILGLDY